MTMKAKIIEQGNGLPTAGDYCSGTAEDGTLQLFRVDSIDSHIQTGNARGNWVFATVSDADYSDCDESDEHDALVVIEVVS